MGRKKNEPVIDLHDDDFGAVLNWAVRYCMGRMSYAPDMTIRFITPLLPYLNDKTLWCFDEDIAERKKDGRSFGMDFDEERWMRFWEAVKAERARRKDG